MSKYQEPRKVRYSTDIDAVASMPVAPSASPRSDNPPVKRRRWLRWFGWALVLLIALMAIYLGILINNVAKISTQPLSLAPLTTDGLGRTNALLLGYGDDGHAGQNLTDTIMLLSVNQPTNQVAQVSVPRDLRVQIPGFGYAKINSANAKGGIDLASQTVSNTLGVPVNYYVTTNFSGFVAIINAVGGLEVNVAERLSDPDYPCDDNQYKACGLDIQPGVQHMDGTMALKYARCRKGTCGNDYGRAMRQQEIMNLLLAKIVTWQTLLNPNKLIPLTNALSGAIKTNMGAVQLGEFGLAWLKGSKNNPIRLVLSTFPGNYLIGDPRSSDLLPIGGSFSAIQDRVQNIFVLPTKPSDIPK